MVDFVEIVDMVSINNGRELVKVVELVDWLRRRHILQHTKSCPSFLDVPFFFFNEETHPSSMALHSSTTAHPSATTTAVPYSSSTMGDKVYSCCFGRRMMI